jgi:hypothetical protein
MSKDESYAKLSFSTCFAGAVGSLFTYIVGEYPDDKFWHGVMYLIPPLTLVTYTITNFIETIIREWWANKSEKSDVEFIVQECESILKDDTVGEEHKALALETRNNAKMSTLKNKAQRLKKHEVVDAELPVANAKRNRSMTKTQKTS